MFCSLLKERDIPLPFILVSMNCVYNYSYTLTIMLTHALRSVMFSSSYKLGAKGSIITTVSRDSQTIPKVKAWVVHFILSNIWNICSSQSQISFERKTQINEWTWNFWANYTWENVVFWRNLYLCQTVDTAAGSANSDKSHLCMEIMRNMKKIQNINQVT